MNALLLLCWLTPAAAQDPAPLVEAALASHPSLAALEARVEALEAQATGAGSWADPRLALELSNLPLDSFRLRDHPMAGVQVKVQQTLPGPGTPGAERQAADLAAQAAGLRVAEAEDALALAVTLTWWDLTLTRQLQRVTATHLDRTEELLEAVTARYEVGTAGQSAVVRLALLRDRLQDDLADYTTRTAALTIALAAATQSAVAQPIDTPAEVQVRPLPDQTGTWLTEAQRSRPELVRLEAEARASEAAGEAAALGARPEPTVWLGYRLRTHAADPQDLVSVGVSVPIPTGSRTRAGAAEATHQAHARAARAQSDARSLALSADLAAAEVAWRRATQKAETYRTTLLPAAQAALETTLADYTVDRATFASLYEAEVALLDLERAWRRAVVDTWRLEARVEALIGAPIDTGGVE